MKRFAIVLPLLVIMGCSGSRTAVKPVDSPSPTVSASPSPVGDIGKTDQFGVMVKVNTPNLKECKPHEQNVTKKAFEDCLVEGMTFVQVSNVFGYEGRLVSKSGGYEIRQWTGMPGEYVSASFMNGYLTSKTQTGLD